MQNGISVKDNLVNLIAKIGEKITIRRAHFFDNTEGMNFFYVHSALEKGIGKIISVVKFSGIEKEKNLEVGTKVAMHIAASNPISLNLDGLDPKIVNKEKQVLIEQAISSGKPKDIAEKMVEGRIRKFCEEVVLLEQTFVIDGKTKIKDILKQYSSELGTEVIIDSFKILILGQGIEVEEKDFAAEVAATANQ